MKMGPHCCSYAAPNLLAHLRKEIVKLNAAGEKCPPAIQPLWLFVAVCLRGMTIFIVIVADCWLSKFESMFSVSTFLSMCHHHSGFFLLLWACVLEKLQGAEADIDHLSHPPRMRNTCFQLDLSISGHEANYAPIFG